MQKPWPSPVPGRLARSQSSFQSGERKYKRTREDGENGKYVSLWGIGADALLLELYRIILYSVAENIYQLIYTLQLDLFFFIDKLHFRIILLLFWSQFLVNWAGKKNHNIIAKWYKSATTECRLRNVFFLTIIFDFGSRKKTWKSLAKHFLQ